MWRMVGRPERSDPDELVFNLFHSSTADKGFNFVGYTNKAYDKIAEDQRRRIDIKREGAGRRGAEDGRSRRALRVSRAPQERRRLPAPSGTPASIVDQGGIGIRNFWTFVKAAPASDKKDMIVNSGRR